MSDVALDVPTSDGQAVLRCTLSFPAPGAAPARALCLCLHGLNHTSEAFLPLLAHLSSLPLCSARLDLRGHGASQRLAPAAQPLDLSAARLLLDLEEVLAAAAARLGSGGGGAPALPVLLLGHSLGGALAAKLAPRLGAGCAGLVLLDFVEGTAVPAIPAALAALAATPRALASVDEAVAWALGTGQMHSAAAARLALPFALVQQQQQQGLGWRAEASGVLGALSEALLAEWFGGASAAFMACRGLPRKLLLARLESLADRELTVGHMQGRFQVEVLRESSHCLHMDQPLRAAQALLPFLEAAIAALPQHGGGGGGGR